MAGGQAVARILMQHRQHKQGTAAEGALPQQLLLLQGQAPCPLSPARATRPQAVLPSQQLSQPRQL